MPNYFRWLKLSIDPPESDIATINNAIDKVRKEIRSQHNNQTISKAECDRLFAELARAEAVMNDPIQRASAAKAEFDEIIKDVKVDIRAQAAFGKNITSKHIEDNAKRYNIQKSTLENLYRADRWTIGEVIAPTNPGTVKAPTRYADIRRVNTSIEALQRQLALTGDPATANVQLTTIYEFLEYYSGLLYLYGSTTPGKSAAEWRIKTTTAEIKGFVDNEAVDITDKSWVLRNLHANVLKEISAIMVSDDTRASYDYSLTYDSCSELTMIKKVDPINLTMPSTAAKFIGNIQAHFSCDENVALAIYNEALKKRGCGPYVPQAPLQVMLKCNCGAVIPKDKEKDFNQECPVCHKPLYIECPRCKKKQLTSLDFCACGFPLGEWRMLPEFERLIKECIDHNDFANAQRYYDKIKAYGGAMTGLKSAKDAIDKGLQVRQQLWDKLDALCNCRKYYTAQTMLRQNAQLTAAYQRKAEINEAVSYVDKLRRDKPSPNEDDALNMLATCADAEVTLPPPSVPLSLSVSFDPLRGAAAISWPASRSRNATYTLRRKIGSKPVNAADGDVIACNLSEKNFSDTKLSPGTQNWYILVATRNGIESSDYVVNATPLIAAHEMDDRYVSISASDRSVTISWQNQPNSNGVQLLRSNAGYPDESGRGCFNLHVPIGNSSYNDVDLANGVSVFYRLRCRYVIGGREVLTSGVTRTAVPSVQVAPIQFTVSTSGAMIQAQWTPTTAKQTIKFVTLKSDRVTAGTTFSESELRAICSDGMNVVVSTTDKGGCPLPLRGNGVFIIGAFIQSNTGYVACPPEKYCSLEKINAAGIRKIMTDHSLRISNIILPEAASGLTYCVSTGQAVVSPEQAGGTMLTASTLSDYNNSIIIENVNDNAVYTISMFATYGSKPYSYAQVVTVNHSTLPPASIDCSLVWPTKRFFHGTVNDGKASLEIAFEPTKEYSDFPELLLVYSTPEENAPISPRHGRLLLCIPGIDADSPDYQREFCLVDRKYIRTVTVDTSKLERGCRLRIYLKDRDTLGGFYRVNVTYGDAWTVPARR